MSDLPGAWQNALGAEQQAVYGYGLLGPYLASATQRRLAQSCQLAHQELIYRTASSLNDADYYAPPAQADYPQLYPIAAGTGALTLAVRLEQDAAAAWRYLYLVASTESSSTASSLRPVAQTQLTASAVRAVGWRRLLTPTTPSVAFPGL